MGEIIWLSLRLTGKALHTFGPMPAPEHIQSGHPWCLRGAVFKGIVGLKTSDISEFCLGSHGVES